MREVNLTQGPILSRLVRFSLPMIAGNMLQQVYNLVDTLAYMPAQEFGNAYSLFVSQNFGAGERERIRKGIKMSFALSAAFCALVSCGIFLLAPRTAPMPSGWRSPLAGSWRMGLASGFMQDEDIRKDEDIWKNRIF